MSNEFNQMPDPQAWAVLVGAAKRAIEAQGYALKRVPGRGRSNVWEIERKGKTERASIRTTRDRWFAFPPLKRGTTWKTLDDVDVVFVAAVDAPDNPTRVQVYRFAADIVRERFDAAYAARAKAGQVLKDNFGMWLSLDEDKRGLPASVGSGLSAVNKPIAEYALADLVAEGTVFAEQEAADDEGAMPRTIAEVMDWARQRIASLSGVGPEAVKLDLKIEY
jgi:hypothetical protein